MKPRVMFVIDTLAVGGAERSIIDICRNLAAFDPVIATCFDGEELKPLVTQHGIQLLALGAESGRLTTKVAKAIARERPAIVQALLFRSEVATRIAMVGSSTPLVGSLVNDSYSPIRSEMLSSRGKLKLVGVRMIDALTASVPHAYLSISKTIAQDAATSLHIPTRKIEVIYRGRDPEQFRPDENGRDERRRMLGWGGKFIVLNVARLLARKGQEDLIRAFPLVLATVPEASLVLVGDGPDRNRLTGIIHQLGLGNHVQLLGTRHDVPKLLQACDIFAFPSHYEGQGGALVEAMMSGCAIAASDTPVHRETVVPNESAVLFVKSSPTDVARVICGLAKDRSLLMRLRKTARQSAVSRFDVREIARQHDSFYARTIESSSAGLPFMSATTTLT